MFKLRNMVYILYLLSVYEMGFKAKFDVYYDINFLPYLMVKYSIPLNQINFIKVDDRYVAKYRISIVLKKKGKQLGGDVWDKKYVIYNYSKTVDNKMFIKDSIETSIKYGKYFAYLKIWDKNSQRYGEIKENLAVNSIKGFYISKPWVKGEYSDTVYSDSIIKVSINIYDKSSDTFHLIWELSEDNNKVSFKRDTTLVVNFRKTFTVILPVKELAEDEYLVTFKKSGSNTKSQLRFYLEKPFFKSKRFLERIDELMYIASQSFIDSLKQASSEKRIKLWKRFWEDKDPTPSTEKNEAMEEYFTRVDYANAHFKSPFLPGWKTDMGKIYIKFGPPDEVEKHLFELNSKPYEIWYYYKRGLKFIFVDNYNLGHYTLVYPRGF